MDFLDPQKQRAHVVRLFAGYVLIGVAILIATLLLLRVAFGFGLDKNGQVVQNGFVFVSSQPSGAKVYVNNKLDPNTTATRLQLTEGNYTLDLKRTGYHTWHRQVAVSGGSVSRYDYPLLVPDSLTSTPLKNYTTPPELATQSPDRHWMLVRQPANPLNFDVYDLNDPKAVTTTTTVLSLPDAAVTDASGEQSWQLTEWSTDNRHVVLQHNFAGGSEYILIDRADAAKTVNLTRTLHLSAGQVVSLRDKKYDRYYVFDAAAKTVTTVALADPATVTPVLTGTLAFKSYGADILLYATETGAPAGRVETMLRDGDITYKLRDHAAGGPYLLDLAKYSGDWYVAVGSSADNKVYVYKNPQAARRTGKVSVLVPVQILRLPAPNYVAFSSNTRFIMAENSTNFAVYDAETDKGYTYRAAMPIDAPQPHAVWMDGDRLSYVSGGKQIMFDYDNTNMEVLAASNPTYPPFFDRNYTYLYSLTPPAAATGQSLLTQTSLLIPTDQ